MKIKRIITNMSSHSSKLKKKSKVVVTIKIFTTDDNVEELHQSFLSLASDLSPFTGTLEVIKE